ncbi:unnamed protein product [Ilex paraguariensis]|uniref:Uncharacterized protein n=1 Tax=Ilex paraguariensis TaxID=185542 RepID=A0ABC8T7W8_9AQUA
MITRTATLKSERNMRIRGNPEDTTRRHAIEYTTDQSLCGFGLKKLFLSSLDNIGPLHMVVMERDPAVRERELSEKQRDEPSSFQRWDDALDSPRGLG